MKKITSSFIGIIALAGSLLFTSCHSSSDTDATLTAKDFKAAMAADKEALILDVRTASEFSNGHLDNAINIDWNLGADNFKEAIKNVPKDKKILVYCQGGSRSATAAIQLKQLGYTNVQELEGGIVAWNTAFGEQADPAVAAGMSMKQFNDIVKTDKVVLVDFNAEWCPPCQKMKPFLKEIQKKGEVEVLFIDTDKNPAIAQLFKISGLPTLMIYKDGVKQWQRDGFMYQEDLEKELENYKN